MNGMIEDDQNDDDNGGDDVGDDEPDGEYDEYIGKENNDASLKNNTFITRDT
jgi:hypothetical protein